MYFEAINQASLIQGAGQSKVSDPDSVIPCDQDVGGLEVAVAAQTLAESILHAIAALDGPTQALGQVRRAALQVALQGISPSAPGAMYSVAT